MTNPVCAESTMTLSIEEAISCGLVEATDDEVVVPPRYSPSQRELRSPYKKLRTLVDPRDEMAAYRGAVAMCKGDLDKLWSLFNVAYDTAARGPIRHKLVSRAAKPLRGFERAVDDLVKSGKFSEDQARKKLAPIWGVDLKNLK